MMIVDNSKVTQAVDIFRQSGALKREPITFPKRSIQVQFLVGTPYSTTFYLSFNSENPFASFPVISLNIPMLLGMDWGKTLFETKQVFFVVNFIIGLFSSKLNLSISKLNIFSTGSGESYGSGEIS